MKIKNFIKLFLITIICVFCNSCEDENEYAKGYSDAYHDIKKPNFLVSKSYLDGKEQALDDLGYQDAIDYKKPSFKNDPDYMDGYIEEK